MNGHGLGTPLVMQLCDEWGNPSPDQRVEIGMKNLSSQMKVYLREGRLVDLCRQMYILGKYFFSEHSVIKPPCNITKLPKDTKLYHLC